MQDTSISWADWTWNPTRGCSRISPGCVNCYAEKIAARFSGAREIGVGILKPGSFSGFAEFKIVGGKREAHWTSKVELLEEKLREPLSWRKKALLFAEEHGRKPRCFVNSMSDLFHENLPFHRIDDVFDQMRHCEWITYLVLTKRAARMYEYFDSTSNRADYLGQAPWIWLGVSVEDQKRADERIPHLLRMPAAVRFLSVEPMLEEIVTCSAASGEWLYPRCRVCGHTIKRGWHDCPTPDCLGTRETRDASIDWVIIGGESGPGARLFNIAWAQSLRDQCKTAGVAFFMKQIGSNMTGDWHDFPNYDWDANGYPIKARNGDDPAEWAADLRVQQYPEAR